jgi:hypothetical protein
MSSSVASSSPAGKATGETRLAKLFGLHGDNWLRHANPVSVWTRFAVLPLLAISIWSRDWIGWWSLVPIVLSLVFMMINPLLFPKPLVIMVYGLVRLDLLATVSGMLICQVAKAWYLDRMVLLFDDMKTRHAEYAAWEY